MAKGLGANVMAKKNFVLVFSCAVLSIFIQLGNATASKVRVSVYYESLCPTSRDFFVTQLYPTWKSLSDIMEVDLNAYGKTSETGTDSNRHFLCQHGEAECQGNKLLTCAKKHVEKVDDIMAFSHCIMDEHRGLRAGAKCASAQGINYTFNSPIDTCVRSRDGDKLLHDVGVKQKTSAPSLYYVPWVLINDVFSQAVSYETQSLKKAVCDAYQGTPPPECA